MSGPWEDYKKKSSIDTKPWEDAANVPHETNADENLLEKGLDAYHGFAKEHPYIDAVTKPVTAGPVALAETADALSGGKVKSRVLSDVSGIGQAMNPIPNEMGETLLGYPIIHGSEMLAKAIHPEARKTPYTSLADVDYQQKQMHKKLNEEAPGEEKKAENFTTAATLLPALVEHGPSIVKSLAPNLFDKLADTVGRGANVRSAAALGLERSSAKKLGDEGVQELGKYGLENKIVTPFASTETKMARNQSLQDLAMQDRAKAYDLIDKSGFSQFNPTDAATKIEGKVGNFNRQSPLLRQESSQLQDTLDALKMHGDQNIPVSKAQDLISKELGSAANFDTNRSSGANDIAKKAYGEARNYLNESAGASAKAMEASPLENVPDLQNILESSNKKYSMGEKVNDLLNNRIAREQGNKMISPSDYVFGAAGAVKGGPIGAVKALGFKKALNSYGNNIAATGLDKISNLLKTSPQSLGKFAPVMQDAFSRGSQAAAATHFVLSSQYPSYRQVTDQIDEDQGQ